MLVAEQGDGRSDVQEFDIVVAEEHLHGAQATNATLAQQFARSQPLQRTSISGSSSSAAQDSQALILPARAAW
jgi:hypothetical protein